MSERDYATVFPNECQPAEGTFDPSQPWCGLGSARGLTEYNQRNVEKGTRADGLDFFRVQKGLALGHSEAVARLLASSALAADDVAKRRRGGGAAPLGLSTGHTSRNQKHEQSKITHRHLIPPKCRMDYAKGGNFAACVVDDLSFRLLSGSDRLHRETRSRRGLVEEFSSKARGRLLELVNSVDRAKVPAGNVWFGTLTYPSSWPTDPKDWKAQLKLFIQRFEYRWGQVPIVHKLEYQRRGAPHFHLLLIWAKPPPNLEEFRAWMAGAWYAVVGSGDERHLRAGTQCDPAREWGGVSSYIGKYMSKEVSQAPADPETGEIYRVGRFWGVHRKHLLPRTIVSEELTPKQAYAVKRVLRKLAGRKRGGLGHGTVKAFVLANNCERLVEWVKREKWEKPLPKAGECQWRCSSIQEAKQFYGNSSGRSEVAGDALFPVSGEGSVSVLRCVAAAEQRSGGNDGGSRGNAAVLVLDLFGSFAGGG